MYLRNLEAVNGITAKHFATATEREEAAVAMYRALSLFYLHAPVTELDHMVHQMAHVCQSLPMFMSAMWVYERHQRFNR